MFVKTAKIDPATYPFKKLIDTQAHLDTDELRHTIKPVFSHIPTDFAGQEHLYCDPDQLDSTGAYRTPKVMQQAKARGFSDPIAMYAADQKAAQDAKDATIADQQSTFGSQRIQIGSLQNQLTTYITLTEERMNKIATLLKTVLPTS